MILFILFQVKMSLWSSLYYFRLKWVYDPLYIISGQNEFMAEVGKLGEKEKSVILGLLKTWKTWQEA